jgi:predicted TIM-barrel fold metal-dependent hydrolase
MADTQAGTDKTEDSVIVVSCDSHVGPLVESQLRPYCPKRHLEAFDEFVSAVRTARTKQVGGLSVRAAPGDDDKAARADPDAVHPNMTIAGHHDVYARLGDMNRDGVAAEVIYHYSQNGELLPFVADPAGGLSALPAAGLELGAVGYEIYNRWLADFVSVEPARHIGLAYLPTWDVDAAVRALGQAAKSGLRGINFPPPGRPGHLEYNDLGWEPFWSACEDLGMSLHTHSSGAAPINYFAGPGGQDILAYECGGWMTRRAIWWLVHGRVFERHPKLRLVITEQYEGWWTATLTELDSVYERFGGTDRLARMPSEYVREQVAMGASFMSTALAEQASREHFDANVLWGRDYPHVEGVFQVLDDPAAEPITRTALRHVLSRVPPVAARRIAGDNAVRMLGLDREELAKVARQIGAPTIDELRRPPSELPEISFRSNAFRGQAGSLRSSGGSAL